MNSIKRKLVVALVLTAAAFMSCFFGKAHAALLCINFTEHVSISWSVGQPTAAFDRFLIQAGDDLECQADGDELAYVLHTFTGIHGVRNQAVVIWSGDDAFFIVENI
jgi:hypothetical protein